MTLRFTAMLAITSALVFAAGTKKMTMDDALAIHRVAAPHFSPDGHWIAFTVSDWDRKNDRQVAHIWLAAASASPSPVKLTNGETGESQPQWSPDGTRIAFLADRTPPGPDKKGGNQIWIIRASGGEAEKLTSEDTAISSFRWAPDGRRIAYITRDTPQDKAERDKRKKDKFDAIVVDRNFTYSHIWTVDLASKTKKRVTEGSFSASSPEWSHDSKSIAYVASKTGAQESGWFELNPDRNTDIYVVSAEGGTPRQITSNPGADSDPQWSPDGREIAYVSESDPESWADKTDVMMVPAGGGSPRNLTASFPDSAGNGLKWSSDGKFVYWNSQEGVRHHIFRVANSGGHIEHVTEGDRIYTEFDISPDGKRVTTLMDDGSAPADLWLFDVERGGGRTRVTEANPQIADFAVADSGPVKWKGPDNFEVEGVLTKPLGYTAGTHYPLILEIHGGPYGANDAHFNARRQIFAANGYAILSPNPRGSTGYGMKFEQANVADWGGKDFQDLMAGVDAMVAQGIADPNKLVVMGGSYGGFMTFWTITQTNRFKAAIGHAGISDWYSFYGQSDIPGLMKYAFRGAPWQQADLYRKWSPMTYIDHVKTPIMITHGEQDHRVPIEQGEEYYRALKGHGVDVVFVRYPREPHSIGEPNHQLDLMKRQLDWFNEHLQ